MFKQKPLFFEFDILLFFVITELCIHASRNLWNRSDVSKNMHRNQFLLLLSHSHWLKCNIVSKMRLSISLIFIFSLILSVKCDELCGLEPPKEGELWLTAPHSKSNRTCNFFTPRVYGDCGVYGAVRKKIWGAGWGTVEAQWGTVWVRDELKLIGKIGTKENIYHLIF